MSRPRFWGAAALLAAAVGLAYAPGFSRPLMTDEIDVVHAASLPGPERRRACAAEFVRAQRFRPAMALVICEVYRLGGNRPVPLRLVLLGVFLLCAAGVGALALALGLEAGAALLSAGLFSFAWCHWENMANPFHIGQLLSVASTFAGLALAARRPGTAGLAAGLAVAAAGTLFKEDGLAFGPLALALLLILRRRARPAELAVLAGGAAAYAVLRWALVSGFSDVATAEHAPSLAYALSPLTHARGLRLAAAPLFGPLPPRLDFGAGAALCALLGAGAGVLLPLPKSAKSPRAAAAFGLALALLGLWPFVFFDGSLIAHRVGRSAGGAALLLALGATALAARLGRRSPAAARALLCALLASAAGLGAAAFRRPDASNPLFIAEELIHDAEHLEQGLAPLAGARAGDLVTFKGFRSFRASRLFETRAAAGVVVVEGEPGVDAPAAEGGRVWRARLEPGRLNRLTVRRWPDGAAWTSVWTAGRCEPACR